ncbi:hypothetical protein B0H34DRAFT_800709 [Crassisporium funariophilum]|nr:hypothetical protein B0H34DRAFT_800709 [Crassisporium funariophilum]
MPTSDLPLELWLEILSYLPRSTLHKMIGINRILFEIALDDIYEEVRFVCDDKDTRKTFKQLRHADISNRVRHLLIRPAFLPGLDEDVNASSATVQDRLSTTFTYMKNLRKLPSKTTIFDESLRDPAYEILDIAKRSIKFCQNLRELTIILRDHALTLSFMSFLNSMWNSDSIGPNLQKLSLETTLVKLPLLLNPLVKCSKQLSHLETFDLNIAVSRFQHTLTERDAAIHALESFLDAFNGTLTSLTISFSLQMVLRPFFEFLPHLPKLKKLELLVIFNVLTLDSPLGEHLAMFIAKHTEHLEHLVIKPHPRQVSLYASDETYSDWLSHDSIPDSAKGFAFPQLILPKLRILDVELRERYRFAGSQSRLLLPNLSGVAPKLTTLALTNVPLSFSRISHIIENL